LAGDEVAMVELMEQYQGQVFGLCFRMLRHRQDAEDATQDVFVRVFRSLHCWDSQKDFKPWLLAIAGNRCRTLLANRMRRMATSDLADELPDPTPDRQGVRQLAEEVDRALAGLRPEYREAFVLFHEQQLSYIEISEVLACPVGTAKTWVHRARRELTGVLRRRGVVGGEADDALR